MEVKIYILRDPISNEIRYVGKTKGNLKSRLSNHLSDKRVCHRTSWIKKLQSLDLKPIMEVIDKTNDYEHSSVLEMHYIKKYREEGCKLVNSTDGGEGTLGRIVSEKQKKEQSDKLKGKMVKEKNPFYKKTHTSETKEKMRKSKLGKKMSEETRKKMSELKKGKKPSQKMLDKSVEVTSKKVLQYTMDLQLVKEWKSLSEAGRNGFDQGKISLCCNGKRKHHKYFIWRFK
jgi:group I intron endonuclease